MILIIAPRITFKKNPGVNRLKNEIYYPEY